MQHICVVQTHAQHFYFGSLSADKLQSKCTSIKMNTPYVSSYFVFVVCRQNNNPARNSTGNGGVYKKIFSQWTPRPNLTPLSGGIK